MPLFFDSRYRRTVLSPDGRRSLVVIGRNVSARSRPWGWSFEWELKMLWRVVRRDKTWPVEVFDGVEGPRGRVPRRAADASWVVPDRAAAIASSEATCRRIQRGEAVGAPETQPDLVRGSEIDESYTGWPYNPDGRVARGNREPAPVTQARLCR